VKEKDQMDQSAKHLLNIQHCLNPLHIYCRFVERGMDKSFSMAICRYYELLGYRWLSPCIDSLVKFCNFWKS
jgi:hypothetical protein